MKTYKIILFWTVFLLFLSVIAMSQNPPHPNGGNAPGGGNTPVGGGAPLGEGIVLLLMMGIGYGIKKYQHLKRLF